MNSGHNLAKVFGYILAGFIILMIIAGVTGAIYAISTGSARISIGGEYETVDYTKTFDNIENLDLESSFAQLVVKESNVDKVTVNFINVPDYFNVEGHNGTLQLDRSVSDVWFIFDFGFNDTSIIEVLVPTGQKIEKCEIDSGSGGCELSLGNIGETKIDGGSGKVSVSNLTTGEFKLDAGSGGASVDNLVTDRFEIDSSSGSVSLNDVNTAELEIVAGSGAVKMEDLDIGRLDIKSGSGRVSFEGSVGGDINIESGSGNIVMNIDGRQDDYDIIVESGSGGVWIDDEKMNDANLRNLTSLYDMNIDSGSGRVTIAFSNR